MKTGLLVSLLATILMLFNQDAFAEKITIKVYGTGPIIIDKHPDGSETTKICPTPHETLICAVIVIESSTLVEGRWGDLILGSQRIPVHVTKFGTGARSPGSSIGVLGSALEFISIH